MRAAASYPPFLSALVAGLLSQPGSRRVGSVAVATGHEEASHCRERLRDQSVVEKRRTCPESRDTALNLLRKVPPEAGGDSPTSNTRIRSGW